MKKIVVSLGLVLGIWFLLLLAGGYVADYRVPVAPFSMGEVWEHEGYVVVSRGTWVLEGGLVAGYPIQSVSIECHKDLRLCYMATATVVDGKYLNLEMDYYSVDKWESGKQITFTSDNVCSRTIFSINISSKSVSSVRKRKEVPDNGANCEGRAETIRAQLKDGFPVYLEEQRKALPWFGRLAFAPLDPFLR